MSLHVPQTPMPKRPSQDMQHRSEGALNDPARHRQRQLRAVPIRFTGTGEEYFRIWIVNTLLTLATLGIYSAWAKVRRLRYFYGNTYIERFGFDYHARPIDILKGRLIVVGGLFGLSMLQSFAPIFGGVLYLCLIAVV
ncbi:MAG: DUF898 family protein [Rhodospirillaceae bacterium]